MDIGHRVNENGVEQKKCSHEKIWKDLSEFSKRKASKDGLSYNCKECDKMLATKSYKNKKNKKKQHQRYVENKEKIAAKARERYMLNREAILDRCKVYRKENPDVFRAADSKRRELLKAAEKDGVSRADIIKRDSELRGGKLVPICKICHLPIENDNELQIDHITPVNQGGADTAANKRTVHKLCNIMRPKDGRDVKTEGV